MNRLVILLTGVIHRKRMWEGGIQKNRYFFGPTASKRNQEFIIDNLIRYHRPRQQGHFSSQCPAEPKSHGPMQ